MRTPALLSICVCLIGNLPANEPLDVQMRIADRQYHINLDGADLAKVRWDQKSDPPIGSGKILKIAEKHVSDTEKPSRPLALESIELRTLSRPNGYFYYRVFFTERHEVLNGMPQVYAVVLLLDGTIVHPSAKREETETR